MEKYMETDLRYLKSLANQYPTVAAAATEIINLQAILSRQREQNISLQIFTASTISSST